MSQGKLIAFEGIDGCGKETQAKLLYKTLKKEKVKVKYISFPRYEELACLPVSLYLKGGLGDVNPQTASLLFAMDRLDAKKQIKKWLKAGYLVISNRYVMSNIVHQGARLNEGKERTDYINWIEDIEYNQMAIPRPGLQIIFNCTVAIAQKLRDMRNRTPDILEKDRAYQEKVSACYRELSEKNPQNIIGIDCVKNNEMRSIEDIQKEVYSKIKL